MLYLTESTLPGCGLGLFTDAPIKKGEQIAEYTGEIVTWSECERRAQLDQDGYVFFISKKYCIDAFHTPTAMARYANDAEGLIKIKGFKNNSEYVNYDDKKVFIEAKKNIPAGSEIFVGYGKDYWKVFEPTEEHKKLL